MLLYIPALLYGANIGNYINMTISKIAINTFNLAVIPTSQRTLLFDYYFSSPFLQCSYNGVLVIMNLIDAGSSQVCNSHRLIVISHQRSCVPISSYQYRKCSSCTGRYSLSETDIESPNIIPVTERMVREFKSNILRTDCHSHRRKSIEVCSSD